MIHALLFVLVQEASGLRWPLLKSGVRATALRATYGQYEGNPKRGGALHVGVDFLGKAGQLVYAVEEGTVIDLRLNSSEFNAILVESKDVEGRAFLYLHVDPEVNFGDVVTPGKRLGRIAQSNTATGETHLHLARVGGDFATLGIPGCHELASGNPLRLLARPKHGGDDKEPVASVAGAREDDGGWFPPSASSPVPAGYGTRYDVILLASDGDPKSTHLFAPYRLSLRVLSPISMVFAPLELDGPLLPGTGALYETSDEFPTWGETKKGKYDYYFILTNAGEPGGHRSLPPGSHELEITVEDAFGKSTRFTQTLDIP